MSYLKQTTRMGAWRAKQIRKTRASRSTGRSKGLVPPTWARACAKQSRAYKNNENYARWCAMCTGEKIKWSSK